MKKHLIELYSSIRNRKNEIVDSLFGDRNYTKFVIISDSRTGSTLLQNMLNFHPGIVAKGELYKVMEGKKDSEIWWNLFRKYPKNVRYVGFKLFYHHPLSGNSMIWNLIKEDRSILIIHLIRKNILRSLVSKKIGAKTRMWTENINAEPIPLTEKKVKIDVLECEEYFRKISNYQAKIDAEFNEHRILSVTYEDLALNRRKVIDELYLQLELEEFKRDSELKKQNPEAVRDLILNYEEVEDYFKETKWEKYFQYE
ncbi:hypothetical protein [Christiangramia sp.]|uniref:hypothetical protein n=1 Tax=Christiangramia sp. TaxID=1931228 RepID=UPI003242647F